MVDGSVELFPAEGGAEEFEVGGLSRFKVDGQNVEADGDFARGQSAQVVVCHFAEHTLFVGVDGGLGGDDGSGGSRFDLDEAEGVVFPCDQVEVAACPGCAPASGGDDEASTAEVEVGGPLAAASCDQMRGLAAAAECDTVEALNKALKPEKAKVFEAGHTI